MRVVSYKSVKYMLSISMAVVSGFAQESVNLPEPADVGGAIVVEPVTVVEPVGETVQAPVSTNGEYPVTLEFTDAKIQDVLSALSELRPNTSILVDPDVTGTVTLNLKNVPWNKALELILVPRGFAAIKASDNIFRVSKSTEVPEGPKVSDKLSVEFYEDEEFAKLSKRALKSLLATEPGVESLSEGQLLTRVQKSESIFVKRLFVDKQAVDDVLNLLARQAELNFSFTSHEEAFKQSAAAPAAPGQQVVPPQEVKVSLNLKNLPFDKVLTMVASRGGYSCLLKDGIWEIAPRKAEAEQPLEIGYFEVEFLPIDDNLIKVLKEVISKRGSISAGKNKIIIAKGTPDDLESIRKTLLVMDKQTPQVSVEARFFELTDGDSRYVGMDWSNALGAMGTSVNVDPYTHTNVETIDKVRRKGTLTREDKLTIVDDGTTDGSSIVQNIVETVTDPTGSWTKTSQEVTSNLLDIAQFNVVLRALLQDEGAKQLANPKVIVASGEQATIHIGEKEPIIKTEIDTEGETAKITTELDDNFGKSAVLVDLTGDKDSKVKEIFANSGTPGYLDLGTILTVAPVVKNDRSVYIKVIPMLVNKIGEKRTVDSVNSYPILFNTKVHTEFTIQSGVTIAIGGLVNEKESKGESKVPVLGDIPLLGRLFRYETNQMNRSETVIFLTVKIVNSDELKSTSGVPINSELVTPLMKGIMKQDRQGAEYRFTPDAEEDDETEAVEEAVEPAVKQAAEEVEEAPEEVEVVIEDVDAKEDKSDDTKKEAVEEAVIVAVEEKDEEKADDESVSVEEVKAAVEEVKAEEVKPAVEEKVEEVKPAVEEKVEEVKPAVEEKVEEVKPDVEEKVEEVKPAVEEKVEEVKPVIEEKVELHPLEAGEKLDKGKEVKAPVIEIE